MVMKTGMKYYLANDSFIKLAIYSSKVDNLIKVITTHTTSPTHPFPSVNSGSNNIWGAEEERQLS